MKNNSFLQNKRKRTLFFLNVIMILFVIFQLSQIGLNNSESMTFVLFLFGDLLLLTYQIIEIIKGYSKKQ
ncbi:MAG: hypothetical protein ACRC5W_10610 [Cetobacterium sp.]|uniref:hypothetical protein n=1 Tax=Cetobacterium sp. TaxID=2071632 RepID=UPI003F392BE3